MNRLIPIIIIITQVIIEILALSLVENGVIKLRYNHLRRGDYSGWTNFQKAASRFVNVSEEEINLMKENTIPRNTKHAVVLRVFRTCGVYLPITLNLLFAPF